MDLGVRLVSGRLICLGRIVNRRVKDLTVWGSRCQDEQHDVCSPSLRSDAVFPRLKAALRQLQFANGGGAGCEFAFQHLGSSFRLGDAGLRRVHLGASGCDPAQRQACVVGKIEERLFVRRPCALNVPTCHDLSDNVRSEPRHDGVAGHIEQARLHGLQALLQHRLWWLLVFRDSTNHLGSAVAERYQSLQRTTTWRLSPFAMQANEFFANFGPGQSRIGRWRGPGHAWGKRLHGNRRRTHVGFRLHLSVDSPQMAQVRFKLGHDLDGRSDEPVDCPQRRKRKRSLHR